MDGTTVSYPLALSLLSANGGEHPLAAELRYTTQDPLAVEALFDDGGDEPVRWVFARDLLSSDLTTGLATATSSCGLPTTQTEPGLCICVCARRMVMHCSRLRLTAFRSSSWRRGSLCHPAPSTNSSMSTACWQRYWATRDVVDDRLRATVRSTLRRDPDRGSRVSFARRRARSGRRRRPGEHRPGQHRGGVAARSRLT